MTLGGIDLIGQQQNAAPVGLFNLFSSSIKGRETSKTRLDLWHKAQ